MVEASKEISDHLLITPMKFRVGHPHARCEASEDLLVGQRFARRFHDPYLGAQVRMEVVPNQVVEFEERSCGQDDVRIRRRVSREAVDRDHEEVVTGQGRAVGPAAGRRQVDSCSR